MGNATSGAGEGEGNQELQTMHMTKMDNGNAAGENLLDFSSMFDVEGLHKALINIKDPPGGVVTRKKEDIVKWLKTLVDRDEFTVNMVQWVDFLTGKGATRQEAMESFAEIDRDGESSVNVTYLLTVLKDTGNDPMQALMPCYLLPGPEDVYVDEKSGLFGLGRKLVQFLQRHRVRSEQLVVPSLDRLSFMMGQREKLVRGRYHTQLDREKDEELMGGDDVIDEGMERMVITNCYSKVTVSTTGKSVDNLFDGRIDTHWQSNGSPRSHWIRIHMLRGMLVKELAITVDSSDDSYMPKNITVMVGNSESGLKELKSLQVPRDLTGRFMLLQNLGTEYHYVQISIKSCHSDGCDTRIRGVHIKGCKFVKGTEPTVLDTMAIWYLSILASTAKAAMPVAPQLREMIMSQSKVALKSLQPLILSPTSPAKPEFLSPFVLAEMDSFLTAICLPGETFVSVDADSVQVLLSFALAHGSVNSIMDCLQILLDNLSLDLPLTSLLNKVEDVQRKKQQKHAENVRLSIVECDGGQKDESHSPECMLTNDIHSSGNSYVSDSGHKIVNVLLCDKEEMLMQVTRVMLKAQQGDQGVKAGLLFLFDCKDPKEKGLLEKFSQYDTWTSEDYKKYHEERDSATDVLAPIAYFETDAEIHEVEFTPDVARTGKYLLLKLLGPAKESAERLGVHSLQVYSHRTTAKEIEKITFLKKMDVIAPVPSDPSALVDGALVLIKILSFLAAMLRNLNTLQLRRKAASLDPSLFDEPHLACENLQLEKIWNLYIPLTLNPDERMEYASILCLYVLRAALPFIKPPRKRPGTTSSNPLSVPSAILSHFCGLLDSKDVDPDVKRLAQDIVVEGVVLFFPDATARKNYLLSMIDSVLDESRPRSWWLKFEALCHYFSKQDSNSLLGLPTNAQKDAATPTAPALNILTTMLTVAMREADSSVSSGSSQPDDLVKLLCALQASLFFWCRSHITGDNKEMQKDVATLLQDYVGNLVTSSVFVLRKLDGMESVPESLLTVLEKTIIAKTLPEMLVFLSTMSDLDINRVKLIDTIFPLVGALSSVTSKIPEVFLKVDSDVLRSDNDTEAVLALWTRESPHNYENNTRTHEYSAFPVLQAMESWKGSLGIRLGNNKEWPGHIYLTLCLWQDFVCASASKFVVEFDSQCHTERRYDYLQFTDANGQKQQFDDTVGSGRWPKTAEFVGPKLHMYFHSDGSNNEWGYKFTLKAIGKSFPSLSWLFDMTVSLGRLIGLLCSATLSTRTTHPQAMVKQTEEEKEEELLVHSDVWKTLFRGGYMVGKLTRSLSGAFAASPADSALNLLLQDLAHGAEGTAKPLLEICRASSKGPFYGGPLVDNAINAVFAALIWHSQEIREELAPFASLPALPRATAGLIRAFTAAEAMRRDLVESRQKVMEEREKEEDEEKKAKIDEDAPVRACHEKAVFLLKFAGLSRIQKDDEDEQPSSPTIRPTWVQKSKKWQKVSAAVSTVGRLKQHLHGAKEQEKLSEKHPSFGLVLNFVKNDAISTERVHALLQQRSKLASSVAQVYTLAAEYIRTIGVPNVFELPGLAFLQQLLVKQNHFPVHYASKLDGCGLDLENQVRKSYRMLIQRLLEAVNTFKHSSKEHSFSHLLVSICLTHLLDFEWQDYDNSLLSELQLPEFLLQTAIKSSNTEEQVPMDKFENEDQQMERYRLHMSLKEKFLALLEDEGHYQELAEMTDNKTEAHLFLVAMSLKYSEAVSVQCDGCAADINTRWYRNMDIEEDLDLCNTCFLRGTGSRPDSHTKENMFQYIGGYGCDGCSMAILTHRFHSNSRQDYDLCLGCFRKEEASGSTDDWTVYLLTEQPATDKANKFLSMETEHSTGMRYKDGMVIKLGPAMDLMVYNQHHCWVLFSSLCLGMASTVNSSGGAKSQSMDGEYVSQACRTLMQGLRLLAFGLRAAVLAKLEEVSRKQSKDASPDKASTPAEGESDVRRPSTTERVVTDASQENPDEDPLVAACKKPAEEDVHIGSQEKTFASIAAERMLGLLAALLPQEMTLHNWIQHRRDTEVFLAEKLLPNLLQFSSVTSSHRFMALLVAAQYMARVNPQVADRAVDVAFGRTPEEGKSHGLKTVQYLFSTGAQFLEKSDFAGATTAMLCLIFLSNSLQWKSAIAHITTQSVKESDCLVSIFGLLVIAGFPKLPHEGRILRREAAGEEVVRGILKSSSGDQGMLTILKTREPKSVKLSHYEVEDTLRGCVDISRLPEVISLLKESLQLARQESETQVEDTWKLGLCLKAVHSVLKSPSSDEAVKTLLDAGLIPAVVKLASKPTHFTQKWRLSDLEVLGIHSYQPATSKEPVKSLVEDKQEQPSEEKPSEEKPSEGQPSEGQPSEGQPSEGQPSEEKPSEGQPSEEKPSEGQPSEEKPSEGQPSEEKPSEEKPLEELPSEGQPSEEKPLEEKPSEELPSEEKPSEEQPSEEKPSEELPSEEQPSEEQPLDVPAARQDSHEGPAEESVLEGLPDEIQDMLKIMKEAFQCRLSVLRALYDAAGEDLNQFIMSSEQYYDMDEGALKPPPDILDLAKKWEPEHTSVKAVVRDIEDSLEDMGVTRLTPMEIDTKDIEALSEDPSIFKKTKNLMKEADTNANNVDHGREESHKLLQEELTKLKEKPPERPDILRTYQAMVVLQARQVLASLLARWPTSGPKLSTTSLGSRDITQYFCLLDLLLRQQSADEGHKVLSTAVHCGEGTEVVSLALVAAQCMGEVCVGRQTREFTHPGKDGNSRSESGNIVIPNASSMKISFHSVKGELQFSSKEDFSDHNKTFEANTTDSNDVQKHLIPGDTVHYKVKLEPFSSDTKPPKCTIVVTGTQVGRFDTGHAILSLLLNEVPQLVNSLSKLWPTLIAMACQNAGSERLKVIGLLRMLLMRKIQSTGSATPSVGGRLELAALKPLWQLYTTMMKDFDKRSKNNNFLAPEIIRALTELFLTVENLAQEWGMSQDLMVEMLTKEGLNTWLEKGISNVAYLSIGLGLDNQASRAFIEAKKNYVPPKAADPLDDVDVGSGGEDLQDNNSSSSSDDDNDDDDDDDDSFEDTDYSTES